MRDKSTVKLFFYIMQTFCCFVLERNTLLLKFYKFH